MATAPIGPLAWEPPYATGAALKSKQQQQQSVLKGLPVSIQRPSWTSQRQAAGDENYFSKVRFCGVFFVGLFVFCLFAFSRAAPAAYGGSQARGPIGAVATGLRQSHSNAGSEPPRLQPTPQPTAAPNP